MNELQKFEFEGSNIRTILVDSNPYWVAKDVANILKYNETSNMLKRLDEDEIVKFESSILDDSNSTREIIFINESGLYNAIMGSKLPKAKAFKKWVTSEVLPAIRKHGMYATDNFVEKALSDPDYMIEILLKFKEEKKKRIEAERINAILTHVNKTYTATEIAKELNLKSAIELNKKLAELKIQFKQNDTWVMYSKYSDCGYEEIKQEVLDNGRVVYHRKITQLGREFILSLFENKSKEIIK